jgi:hypothetical protein
MPLRNRVTPRGELVAVADRGTLLGNRGVLHDDNRRIVRQFQHRRWLLCELTFQGRRRQIMKPHRYTELFFLDEAVALAAGHRPCAECRRGDYRTFGRCFAAGTGRRDPPSADELDRILHAERRPTTTGTPVSRTSAPRSVPPERSTADLPDGAYILLDDTCWLVLGDRVLRWTAGGYHQSIPRPAGRAAVLTPTSTLAALRAGYRPRLHHTAHRS